MDQTDYSGACTFFNNYQVEAAKTASYPERLVIHYPIIGGASESGELLEKLKKQLRKGGSLSDPEWIKGIRAELGDVLWYLAQVCTDLQIPLGDIAQENLKKLFDRRDRGVIIGEGDNR